MKKLITCILILIMLWTPVTAFAESSGWDISAATEVTEEVRTLFDKAAAGLMGVSYVPVAVLGVQDGTYCILCKATVVYPGAEPKNVLMYVNDDGVQNIYELWIDRHAAKENPPEDAADAAEVAAVPEDAAAEPEAGADIQYVMYLGTNDMDTNRPVFTQAEAREKAQEILVRHFGGYTMQEANGGWIDNGVLYQEYTLVIYLSDTTEAAVHAAADELIETFRQSSILIQSNPTRTEFYGAS